MSGSAFARDYGGLGMASWEAAALEIARQGGLTPWPWRGLRLTDGTNTAVLQVMNMPYANNLEHIRMLEGVVPHKVFFGSDAPLNLVTYKSSIEWLKCLPLSVDFKKKLFYDNAKEFYTGEWRKSFGKPR